MKSLTHGRPHAEERFLDDSSIYKRGIKAIWIKNSPCLECAKRLNRECPPIKIYIGHVYREQDSEKDEQRKQEIQKMKQNGFTFALWELYCRKNWKIRTDSE